MRNPMLVQAAHAAGKTKTYLGAQYRRMSKGRGIKRAAVAVGHSILVIYYHMLTTSQPYDEKGEDYARSLRSRREAKTTGQATGAAWVYGQSDSAARRLAFSFLLNHSQGSDKGVFLCLFSHRVQRKSSEHLLAGIQMKYKFVEQHKQEFPIVVMCCVLGVSQSGFDAWRKRPTCQHQREDAQITQEIRTACLAVIKADMGAHASIRSCVIRDEALPASALPG